MAPRHLPLTTVSDSETDYDHAHVYKEAILSLGALSSRLRVIALHHGCIRWPISFPTGINSNFRENPYQLCCSGD